VRRGGDAAHTVRSSCSRIGHGSAVDRAGSGPPQESAKPRANPPLASIRVLAALRRAKTLSVRWFREVKPTGFHLT